MTASEVSTDFSDIVITGVGLVTSLGLNADDAWSAVLANRSNPGAMSAMESPLPPGADGFQAADLPPDYHPDRPREVRYLRWAIESALRDASLLDKGTHSAVDPSRRAIVVGTTLHGMRAAGRYLRSNDMSHLRQFLATDTLQSAICGLGIGGGALTTCSACSSSLGSIALGMTMLRAGTADVIIAGGYDTISEYVWAGFNALRLVTDGPLLPFTKGRKGMKLGEGYSIVVLERAEHAQVRSASIRAVVAGYGESADAHHLTQPHPAGEGAAAAMNAALRQAKLVANDIDLISAHATGTPDNDAAEFAAMSKVFGATLSKTPVVAMKTHIGHTLGAAGAAELILASMAITNSIVPPTANVAPETIEFDGLHVSCDDTKTVTIRRSLNTSLGFGGANTSVILSSQQPRTQASAALVLRDVWITGLGVVLPGAVGLDAFAEKLSRDGSSTLANGQTTLADEDFAHLFNARRARRISGYAKLMLAAASEACTSAGIAADPSMLAQTGAILGTTHGATPFCQQYYSQLVNEGLAAANPVLFAEGVPNVGAAQLSLMLGLKGACQTIIGSRTAGLDALRMAWLRIATGEADRLIVGAAEENSELVNEAYNSCSNRHRPKRPQVLSSDRMITGCGSVAVVLESADSSRLRGARPLGRVHSASAASGRPARLPRTLARLLGEAGVPSRWIGSANRTSVDALEANGFRRHAQAVATAGMYEQFGETFSVTPLIGIAAILAGRSIDHSSPPHVTGWSDRVGILCTDLTGTVSSAVISVCDAELEQTRT